MATPAWKTSALIETIPELAQLKQDLSRFKPQPITTAYFFFDEPIKFSYPMLGALKGYGQWHFDRKNANQPHVLSVVVSSDEQTKALDNQTLLDNIEAEIKQAYPSLQSPVQRKIIKEKHAAFSADANLEQRRPSNKTGVDNLYLAGEYTNTNYPATMEGAVKSGWHCADVIQKSHK